MRNFFALFFNRPPNLEMDADTWRSLQADVYAWLFASVAIGATVIAVIYALRSRAFAIRQPSDPFRAFTPMGWFGLAVLPGLVTGTVYVVRYLALFSGAVLSPAPGAVGSTVAAAGLTLLLVPMLAWIPGITPRKVLYHPRC